MVTHNEYLNYNLIHQEIQYQHLKMVQLNQLVCNKLFQMKYTIKLWDLKERKYFKCFNAHQGAVSDFLLEKDLITVGQDGQINWIDLGNQTIKKSTQFQIPIFCIGQLQQGKYVLGMGDGSIKILKGTKTRDYKISESVIYRLLPLNSKQIVCYSGDGYLCVINLKKSSKIFKSPIQKDGQWQELCQIDKQMMIPYQGNIRVYYSKEQQFIYIYEFNTIIQLYLIKWFNLKNQIMQQKIKMMERN